MFLFEEITPVTKADIDHWLDTIPNNLSASPSRRAAYAKAYNVEEKIRAAKRAGTWSYFADHQENN